MGFFRYNILQYIRIGGLLRKSLPTTKIVENEETSGAEQAEERVAVAPAPEDEV